MQAKDRELAEVQQQLREKVNGVKCVHNVWCVSRSPLDCMQEEQLRCSEAIVDDFQRAIQLRDSQPQGTPVSN